MMTRSSPNFSAHLVQAHDYPRRSLPLLLACVSLRKWRCKCIRFESIFSNEYWRDREVTMFRQKLLASLRAHGQQLVMVVIESVAQDIHPSGWLVADVHSSDPKARTASSNQAQSQLVQPLNCTLNLSRLESFIQAECNIVAGLAELANQREHLVLCNHGLYRLFFDAREYFAGLEADFGSCLDEVNDIACCGDVLFCVTRLIITITTIAAITVVPAIVRIHVLHLLPHFLGLSEAVVHNLLGDHKLVGKGFAIVRRESWEPVKAIVKLAAGNIMAFRGAALLLVQVTKKACGGANRRHCVAVVHCHKGLAVARTERGDG
eukprot:m.76899 g.76899  ORF g.76899 m.76899 type:complete len:320 (+) comp8125_c0_seq1:906-1865(+)